MNCIIFTYTRAVNNFQIFQNKGLERVTDLMHWMADNC